MLGFACYDLAHSLVIVMAQFEPWCYVLESFPALDRITPKSVMQVKKGFDDKNRVDLVIDRGYKGPS